NGAAVFLQKEVAAEELVRGVRKALSGERYLSAPFVDVPVDPEALKPRDATLDPYESLTSREREVMQLVAEGHINTHISRRLNISPRTVEVHRANLMRKLNLQSQTDLIRYALRRGIIQY
ncbi:MAG: response regulator transcription factor, partial [Candidatus Xenobia bacterium]